MGAGAPGGSGADAPLPGSAAEWSAPTLFPRSTERAHRAAPADPGAVAPLRADAALLAPRSERSSPPAEERAAPGGAPTPAHWRSWLDNPAIIARYRALVWQPDPATPGADTACWPWLGAVSDTGHGKFKTVNPRTVNAHAFGFQLTEGVIDRRGADPGHDLVLCHGCDEPGCQRSGIGHMQLGTVSRNTLEFKRRQGGGPLADLRGPAGRTRAIADAVRAGLAAGESDTQILARIAAAKAAGEPATLF